MSIDPTSSSTVGWHLFFELQGEPRKRSQALIDSLAAEFGGPVFVPHVTLLARIPAELDAEARAEEIAAKLQPFSLMFDRVGIEDAYFRALYLKAADPGAYERMHALAAGICGMNPDPAYVPHLSLLYGTYRDDAKRLRAASIHVPSEPIEITTLTLYRTEGEVADWVKIREFSLV